jgi:MoxR-like ATPase
MVQIVEQTRKLPDILMGVSPRGSLALLKCIKAYAYLDGRDYCTPNDVKHLAVPVLSHRIVTGFGNQQKTDELIQQLIKNIIVPTEDFTK